MTFHLTALVLAAAAPWAAAARVEAPADPGTAALERMSEAQRGYAEALARAYGAKAEDVALLRRNGYVWDDAAQAAALAAGWDLDLSRVTTAFAAGYAWADIHEAAKLAAWSGFSFETVLALRGSGLSWKEVAAEVKVDGVDFRDAVRDPAPPKKKAVPAKKKAKPAPKQEPPAKAAGGS
jgi:hypothetical protein